MNLWATIASYGQKLILPAVMVTIIIVFFTVLIGSIIGFGLSVLLILWGSNGLNRNPKAYRVLSFLINLIRSFPILILIITLIPITRAILGTSLGTAAVIFPLSVACTAFTAKIMENAMASVDKQLIEAARSFGATDFQIIFYVMVKDAIPDMIAGLTLTTINFIAATTIAGTVGGGGIGAISLTYGFQSFNYVILYLGVFALLILVNIVQFIGDKIYKIIK